MRAVLIFCALSCSDCSSSTPRADHPRARSIAQTGAAVTVFAHRGASGYRPEHTRAAYELAIEQGADYIEPDVVASKDGMLVVRHENEISGTTDVASRAEFGDRRQTKTIDGESVQGWFTEDFTLAELRTLRAKERLPKLRPGSAAYDGEFPIMTLDEVFSLAVAASQRLGRAIGVCPETKHPSYFASIGLPLEPPLVAALEARGWNREDAPVCVQSFEVGNLKALDDVLKVPLVQLVWIEGAPADGGPSYSSMVTSAGLADIATYADIVSPHKNLIIARNPDGSLADEPTSLVADAHRAGLKVVAYTFRAERPFLPSDMQGDLPAEIARFVAAGIDGLFTDFPDIAVRSLR